MRKCDLDGACGGLDIEGERDEDAELSPVLGMTGKRLLNFLFTGTGFGASNLMSLVKREICVNTILLRSLES